MRSAWLSLASAAWIGALAAGASLVWSYSTTPGEIGRRQSAWPIGSRIPRTPGERTLVLFAHPHCPCTRASLAELEEIMRSAGDEVTAVVLFLKPEGTERDWERSDTWAIAERIPGAAVRVDERGDEAARFGAVTSGDVMLYGADGALLYSGGITGSRGHRGDNAGRRRLLALLRDEQVDADNSSVFGCPLFERARP